MSGNAHHKDSTAAWHYPYFCNDCKRAHTSGVADTRAILGERGTTLTGHAYAWCHREGLYHVERAYARGDAHVTRWLVCERALGITRERARVPWTDNTAQPERPVRAYKMGTRAGDRIMHTLARYAPSRSQSDNAQRARIRAGIYA